MVYLREIFMAELTESMNDGVGPFFLRLIVPFGLTLLYHRRLDLFVTKCTAIRLLALYGLLMLINNNRNSNYYQSIPTNDSHTATSPATDLATPTSSLPTNVHVQHSPTVHVDPVIRARSGWRGWDSIRNMPIYKQNTYQPAFQQLLYILCFLSMASQTTSFITGFCTEFFGGIFIRLTQCSNSFGGEQVLYYGMVVRVVSCFIVAWFARLIPSWTNMLIPMTTTLTDVDGNIIVRDHTNAIHSMIISYAVILVPCPFLNFKYVNYWFDIGHSERNITDDIDFEMPSKLSQQIDCDKTAGERFWKTYFEKKLPSVRRPAEAAVVEKVVRDICKEQEDVHDNSNSGRGDTSGTSDNGKEKADPIAEKLQEPKFDDLFQEIDLPVLFSDSININNEEKIESLVESLNVTFLAGWSRPIHQRKRVLMSLRRMIIENEDHIIKASYNDLGRPAFETMFWECRQLILDINYLLHHIDEWTSNNVDTKRCRMLTWPSSQWLRPEPLGVILILGSWTYPFLSILSPLAGGKYI